MGPFFYFDRPSLLHLSLWIKIQSATFKFVMSHHCYIKYLFTSEDTLHLGGKSKHFSNQQMGLDSHYLWGPFYLKPIIHISKQQLIECYFNYGLN